MTRTRATLAATALALTLAAAARPISALEAPTAVRPTWGVLIESLLDPSVYSEIPSPSLSFNFGAGVVMPFSPDSRFSFEPSGELYWFYGEYIDGRAVPSGSTFGSAFVLGLLLDAPVVYSIPLGDKFQLGFGLGGCLDLRAAFTSDSSYKPEDTPRMNRYFWEKGRFFAPSTMIRGEYKLTERVGFGFAAKVLWPIFSIWSGEGFGFFDQGMYIVELTIRYNLHAEAAPPITESPPPPPAITASPPAPATAAPPASDSSAAPPASDSSSAAPATAGASPGEAAPATQ